jgi:hypothetical protein
MMMFVHQFAQSQQVEARHAARLDAWIAEGYRFRDATTEEQWQGIDRVVMTDNGPVTLDYKCDERAQTTKRLFFETVSNATTGRRGWMHTSRADWFVYFVVPNDVWMFRFERVRPLLPAWKQAYGERGARNATYTTLGVCVPMAVAIQAVEYIAALDRHDGAIFETSDRWTKEAQ